MPYRSILLIDDDADDQLIFNDAIHNVNSNIRYDWADNGLHALNKLRKGLLLPDLIFVDLNMPVINGFDFISLIKNEEGLKHIPVVAFTTSTNPLDAVRARRLGANAFLSKSSNYHELCRKLRTVVNADLADFASRAESDFAF
jgi:CheY-like chemotaxis protein